MNIAFISTKRIYFLLGMIVLFFTTISLRLGYLHVFEHTKLERIVEANRQRFEIVTAKRGNIVDLEGNILASTQMVMEIGVDPHMQVAADRAKLAKLAVLLHMPVTEVQAAFDKCWRVVETEHGSEQKLVRWVKLAEAVDESVYGKIQQLNIKGVYGNQKFRRVYPAGGLGCHVIGYVNKEHEAVMGVEAYLDFYLRGQDGWIESEKDGRRREMAHLRTRQVNPTDGYNVELTIDMNIQHIIEEEVKFLVDTYTPKGVTIIVSDPANGHILGLANYPSFDPNTFWKFELDTMRNRAITDVYEPGSPFKIVSVAGALDQSLVKPDDVFDCKLREIPFDGRVVRLPKDDHPNDVLTVREILVKSSNRGVAQLAMLLGSDRLLQYARSFGFGEATGYGPRGEVKGILHPTNKWDGLTISRMPMGHAIGSTPMQMHYAMSVIANQGVLMNPVVTRRVFDDAGGTVMEFHPKAKRRVVSMRVANTMTHFLQEVVESGSGRRGALEGISSCGKTGTTQKIIDGRYSTKHHVASYSGFFPANRPRVVLTIVVDEPHLERCGYGGVVSAPAFRRVGEQLVHYLGIQPDEQHEQMIAWKMNKNTL
jgi:cell division protein FtsI/penicillin-binding protein 2